jgi:hypothetical protein
MPDLGIVLSLIITNYRKGTASPKGNERLQTTLLNPLSSKEYALKRLLSLLLLDSLREALIAS